MVQLYRAVCDAVRWGKWFEQRSGVASDRIIAIQISEGDYAALIPKYIMLDGIGPSCFADGMALAALEFDAVIE